MLLLENTLFLYWSSGSGCNSGLGAIQSLSHTTKNRSNLQVVFRGRELSGTQRVQFYAIGFLRPRRAWSCGLILCPEAWNTWQSHILNFLSELLWEQLVLPPLMVCFYDVLVVGLGDIWIRRFIVYSLASPCHQGGILVNRCYNKHACFFGSVYEGQSCKLM